MKKYFFTIMCEGKFINSNFMRDDTCEIIESIKFTDKEHAEQFVENLRKDINFKIVRISCTLEDV